MWKRFVARVRAVIDAITVPSYGSCSGDLIATERDARLRAEERARARKESEWQQVRRRAAGKSPR